MSDVRSMMVGCLRVLGGRKQVNGLEEAALKGLLREYRTGGGCVYLRE